MTEPGGSVSEWRLGRLVAGRELRETLRRKAFWVTVGLFALVSTAAMVVPELIDSGGPTERTVGVVGDAQPALLDTWISVADTFGVELTIEPSVDPATAAADVEDGGLDALVHLDADQPTITVDDDGNQTLIAIVQEGLRTERFVGNLAGAGLTDAEIGELLAPTAADVVVLDTERGGRQGIAAIAALVMYLLLLLLAMQIAQGVAVEKSSRVSEVLLAIVPARALLFGKIVGVGIVGLLTLAAGAVPVAVRLAIGASMPSGTGSTLAAAIVFSMLGIALYLCIAGSLGALVERTEEVGSTVGPITSVLILGYLLGQFASGSIVGRALAHFPLTSPLVMPSRVALGEVGALEVAISIGLLVAGVVLAARFATVVYRRAIVRTGRKLTLRDLRAS